MKDNDARRNITNVNHIKLSIFKKKDVQVLMPLILKRMFVLVLCVILHLWYYNFARKVQEEWESRKEGWAARG